MSDRPSSDSQTVKLILVLGGILFCLAIGFSVVVGLVGYRIYTVRQAAIAAAEEAQAREQEARERELQAVQEALRLRQLEEQKRIAEQQAELAEQHARAEAFRADQLREEQARRAQFEEQRRQAAMENERRQQELMAANQKRQELQQLFYNLQQIQAGLRNWNATTSEKQLLPNSEGEGSQLSWRVHLLPYIGFQSLYKKFRLNEPWDSEFNQALIADMPPIYGPEPGNTRFRSLLNVDGDSPIRVGDITDGLEQTALIFIAAETHSVPWTQPDSLAPKAEDVLESLGIAPNEQLYLMTAAGQPTIIADIDGRVAQSIASPAGGEHLLVASQQSAKDMFIAGPAKVTDKESEPTDQELEANMQKVATALQRLISELQDPNVAKKVAMSQLSWRVHLLPYLGEQELYQQLRHDEPWSSNHNAQLIESMPAVFGLGAGHGRSRIQVVTGEDKSVPFPIDRFGPELDLGNQVCLFLSAPHQAVAWTAGRTLVASPTTLHSQLGWSTGTPLLAGFADGKALTLPGNLHPSKITALLASRNKPTFNLTTALESAEKPLRIEVPIKPAEQIAGLRILPEILPPAGGFKQPSPDKAPLMRLRNAAFAIHRYTDAFRRSPAVVKRPDGSASQLSWRVHVLPMLDQGALYEKFALDEPWDSPTNMKLLEFIPELFQNVEGKPTETTVQVLTGEASLLAQGNWLGAPDGLQNTIMLMELPAQFSIPWTQPERNDVVKGLSFEQMTQPKNSSLMVAMGDGTCKQLSGISDEIFFGLATAGGRELIDGQTLDRWSAAKRGEYLLSTAERLAWQQNQLKQLVLAVQNYESTFRVLPPGRGNNSALIPPEAYQLSWRVHLLPFLGYGNLYSQFRLAEPWDSPHNIQLLKCMPDLYRDALDSPTSTETRVMTFTGPGTIFEEAGKSMKWSEIRDGAMNTLMFIQAPANRTVPWTKPEDIAIDASSLDAATPELIKLRNALGIVFALVDGSVLTLPPDFSVEQLYCLITPAGGEIVNLSELRR